jgi:hypothetical protein
MTAALVQEWRRTGQFELPLPGSGRTEQRWHRLSELTARRARDLTVYVGQSHAERDLALGLLAGTGHVDG